MIDDRELEVKLTSFAHDVFSMKAYEKWRNNLSTQEKNRWYSLIVELDRVDCDLLFIKELGEKVYSKLVYMIIRSPDYKKSGEYMILFNFTGKLWHSLIYFSEGSAR